MLWLIDIFIGLVGALIGSFLNVVVWRLPRGRSLVWPGSRCPTCTMPVRPWHNLPVIGWLMLGGRCRDCRASIHWRYPAVEATTGLLFVVAAYTFGRPAPLPIAFALLSLWTVLALIDLDLRRLPWVLTVPMLLAGLAFWRLAAWASGREIVLGLLSVVALGFGTRLYRSLHGVDGLGDGDLLLLAGVAAWLGWRGAALALAVAVVGVGALAIVWALRGRPTDRLPFGTGLAVGAILALFTAAGGPRFGDLFDRASTWWIGA